MDSQSVAVVGMFCAFCLAGGCSTAAPQPSGKVGAQSAFHLAATPTGGADASAGGVLPGYVHTLAASKFKIGGAATLEVNIPTLQRWRGPLGAFAVDPTTGSSRGSLDATASRGPYILDAASQGAMVKDYFVTAGLPEDQVAGVGATYETRGGGKMGQPVSQSLQLYESYAAARMTTAGDVDWEAVFWPPIDMGVVNAAVTLANQMADSVQHGAFVAKLPGGVVRDLGVVIHHTMPALHSAPVAFVSYDVTIGPDTTAAERHFDSNGVEFRLAQEQSTAAVARK